MMTDLVVRQAEPADAEALHALIQSHREEGHLLPRGLEELRRRARHFLVCDVAGQITACGELAPLSRELAEVRSLVVSKSFRRVGLAARLLDEIRRGARAAGFETLCAFTHDARFFVRQNFSIVPHRWLPEKIVTDCLGCPLFRRCGQYAVVQPLDANVRFAPAERRRAVA
jgi:amino-acid N-acetyltransferase